MKQTLLFAVMFVAMVFTSCNDSDGVKAEPGTYPDIKVYATTRFIADPLTADDDADDDDVKCYFETDSGKKIYMLDNAMPADYDFVDGERSVIYIAILEDYSKAEDKDGEGMAYDCDFGARLFGIRKVFVTEDRTVTTEEEEKAIPDHAISYIYNSISYSHNVINLIGGFKADKIDKVSFYLVENQVDTPEETKDKYLNLELRYDRATDEAIGKIYDEYLSISIEKYAEQMKADGMKGIILRVITSDGTKHIIIDTKEKDEDKDGKSRAAKAVTVYSTTPKL